MRRIIQDLGFAGAGCLTTACQIHLTRECLTLFSGNELCLGAALGSWLCGIALGSAAGGWLARRRVALLLPATVLAVVAPLSIVLLRVFRALAGVSAGELPGLWALLAAGALLVLPAALLSGALFPMLCAAAEASGDPQPVGRVYAIESVGAAAGGAVVSMWAAGTLLPFESLALCALPALVFLALAPSRLASRWRLLVGNLPTALLLAASIGGLWARLDEWSAGLRFESLSTGERLLDWRDTPYQRLDLGERDGQFSLYGDGKLLLTFPDPWRELPRAHLILTQHPAPRRVLWLGSSGLRAAPAVLRHGVSRFTVVDMDAGIGALIVPRLDASARATLDDPRVQRVSADGRCFLAETEQRFDVIFSDAPDPLTAAQSRFFSREFFQLARSRLDAGGLLALRLGGAFAVDDAFAERRLQSTLATLEQVFPAARVLPGGETFLLGSLQPDTLLLTPQELADRYRQRGVADPAFPPELFATVFEAERVGRAEQALHRGPKTALNLDDRPTVALFGILREGLLREKSRAGFLEALLAVPAGLWIALGLLPGAALAFRAARRRRRGVRSQSGALVFAVGCAGAAGLSLEIVLSFAYQTLAGSLFRELGFLLAAFMLGLAAAGALLRAYLSRHPVSPRTLCGGLLVFAAFCALTPALIEAARQALPFWAGRAALGLLVFLAGAGTGAVFPLASRLIPATGAASAAARINAADHLGAATGALLAGLWLLPVLGWTGTCWLFAALLAEAAVWLWLAGASAPRTD